MMAAVADARTAIERVQQPDGYNLGVNIGHAAGQTIFHLHVHVIPRYHGDVPAPRGGVRHVIPEKADYIGMVHEAQSASYAIVSPAIPGGPAAQAIVRPPHWRALVQGGDDPLLPHLHAHLATAARVDVAVAFVLERGLAKIDEHLKDVVRRGGRLRVLTGDYLDVTEPTALLRLLDLAALAQQTAGTVELRVFETGADSFHPKAYILHLSDGDGVAFVGSSNLSELALGHGIEWNYRVVPARDRAAFGSVIAAFETLFRHPNTTSLDPAWVARYKARRSTELRRTVELLPEPLSPPPEPHAVQREALAALEQTRANGNAAGLVVLATGLGKTWLAAFDTNRPEYRRVLFVAHREEILDQALATFRRIRPTAVLGLYTGDEKTPEADVLFASIQTLGRARHLGEFPADAFDYIIIDEFHHAAAATYRRLIDHFQPRFLLGLTATPERTDGGDLLALCGENLVFRYDLWKGIRQGLLAPFHYFGVPDEVDYRNIPWRNTRFDEEALTRAVATQARAQNALEQYRRRAGGRTLAFCCSTRHADFMAEFFAEAGVQAVAVHSDTTSAPRTLSLERLKAGALEVIFAVDMFNEGVDLPNVDTIMMLRPTESRIVWMQQFGRGLRKAEHKDHLTVVDYIGNHRTFLLKPQVLLGLAPSAAAVAEALTRAEGHSLDLPPGCEVTYDLRAIEILRALLPRTPDVLRAWYEDFRERHGTRPRAIEAFHDGYAPRSVRQSHGSWLRFVDQMGDLPESQANMVKGSALGPGEVPRVQDFLEELETTPMTKSYKMIVLLAMLNEDRLPGTVTIDELARTVIQLARRSAQLQEDFGATLADPEALKHHLEVNPIAAWSGGAGTHGVAYFADEASRFSSRFDVPAAQREAFQELARELVDWRLAEYLQRQVPADDAIVCKVSHAGGRPILFLPDRAARPDIPEGTTPVLINGQRYEAEFAQIAVNVVRAAGSARNELPGLLRAWFGPDAGLPGTSFQVRFERTADNGYQLVPLGHHTAPAHGPEEWRQYPREAIPPLFGLAYNAPVWNQGFIFKNNRVILLVTLDKSAQAKEHRYEDRFEAAERFQWQSQNKQQRGGATEQKLARHVELGIPVHLFVRKAPKVDGRAAPFLYCGECEFLSWDGDRPITVHWKLKTPVPERWRGVLDVPSSPVSGSSGQADDRR
jgi:superfamily II DNA or RNA helicase